MEGRRGERVPAGNDTKLRSRATADADSLRAFRVWTVVGAFAIFGAVLYALGFLLPVIEFIAVGCIVGFIVIAMYMPMFKVYDAIQ